jgi:hypothetical protein
MLELYGREIAKSLGIEEWLLKPKPGEQLRRYELIHDLRAWDFDLYRPGKR